MYDVAIVGAGVLGAALACEAKALGLKAVVVAPKGQSPSFLAGRWFRLNTWTGADQHPRLEAAIRRADRSRFPVASTLPLAAEALLKRAKVPRVDTEVLKLRRLTGPEAGVELLGALRDVRARAAVLCLGWGPARGLPRGALAFSTALRRFVLGEMKGRVIGVVGAGPSALSFLEACVGLAPGKVAPLRDGQFVTWLQGTRTPKSPPGVKKMFDTRYGPLFRALKKDPRVTVVPRRVERTYLGGGRWRLRDDAGDDHFVDELVWCAGFEPPLQLLTRGARGTRPLRRDGVKLALQRVGAGGPEPVFQVGPALDQLGFASWDTGPYAEWFEKGRRVLTMLRDAR